MSFCSGKVSSVRWAVPERRLERQVGVTLWSSLDAMLRCSKLLFYFHLLCAQSNSVTPWTVADQIPLSMGSPGKNTGVDRRALLQGSLMSPALVLPPR